MATNQHDLGAASAVTVRVLPFFAVLLAGGCTGLEAAVPVSTDFHGHAPDFEVSDGWVNGEQNGCGWRRQNASIEDGTLTLAIDDRRSRGRNFSCGEYRTREHYSFGYYETRARVEPAEGTVTAFFTYTGEPFGDPHDEIDFEWLGRDTTQVQVDYFVDGQGRHEHMIDLGFDAAEDFHIYGFEWRPNAVRWYIDCKLVHEVTRADGPLPRAPGRIFVHLWNGSEAVDDWLGKFRYAGRPVRSTFDYIRHVPGGTHEEGSSCARGRLLETAATGREMATDEPLDSTPETPALAMVETGRALDPEEAPVSAAPIIDAAPADQPASPVGARPTTTEPSATPSSDLEENASASPDGRPISLGVFGTARP